MINDLEFHPPLLGYYLKQARESQGLSLRRLARESGVSHSQILRIESGRFDCFTGSLVRLCSALCLASSELIEWSSLPKTGLYLNATEKELADAFPDGFPTDKNTRKALIHFVSRGAMIIAWLARSADPRESLSFFSPFPSSQIRLVFDEAANELANLAPSVSSRSRYELVQRLQMKPFTELRDGCGFPTAAQVMQYASDFDNATPPTWEPFKLLMDGSIRGLPGIGKPASKKEHAKTKVSKEPLDTSFPVEDKSGMQNKFRTFDELKNHLKKITKPHGEKSALAKHFGVSRQAVDQWLRGEAKPSAEIAIALQHYQPQSAK